MEILREHISLFTDMMKEGFIFINEAGMIKLYNKKAKVIFGIEKQFEVGHEGGKLNEGDIVVIGDNCLGKDDGDLNPEDLSIIGVSSPDIKRGDLLLAIGEYAQAGLCGEFRHLPQKAAAGVLKLETRYIGHDIFVQIDTINKQIRIGVNGEWFDLDFVNAIGHIVVIDKYTGKIRFYQSYGYTARGESIKRLLAGNSFRAKGRMAEEFDVIGRDIFEIHERNATIQEFYDVACGANLSYQDKYAQINGIATLCTLVPVEIDGKRVGAVLKMEDITALKKAIRERDEALSHVAEMKRLLDDNFADYEAFSDIIGESKAILDVKRLVAKAAKTNSTVLLLGESGTGKSMLAEAIHKASARRDKLFVHVNCGAMPETLLESELFGYEKGAFTGAGTSGKQGLFEKANGGTIFLDEIGEMALSSQVKLLKVLQNKSFYHIGGTREITVDVRVIAATNKNLQEETAQGRFREDLFYRIDVFPVICPPLRERKSDIGYLAVSLAKRICESMGFEQKIITHAALMSLVEYDWPGNIRELENVLERAINLSEDGSIDVGDLPFNLTREDTGGEAIRDMRSFKEGISDAERRILLETLEYFDFDKQKVMAALKMGKTNFYKKLNKHKLM